MRHQGLFPKPGRQDHPKGPTHHPSPTKTWNIPVIFKNTHKHKKKKNYHLAWNSLCSELDANQLSSTNCWDVNDAHTARQGWLGRAVPALHHAGSRTALQPARCHGPTGLAKLDSCALGCSQSLKCRGDNKKSREKGKKEW